MSTVLALEPDDRRTGFLRAVVCDQLRASLVVADSAESAVAAVSALIPDVVLVGPDFPPREEIEVKEYLRSLERSTAPEILRVPALPNSAPRVRPRTGLLGTLRRRAAGISEDTPGKEDFAVLASRIAGALDRVRSARVAASTEVSTSQPTREPHAARAPGPAIHMAAVSPEPVLTLPAPRSDAGAGRPQTSPAKRTAAGASSDVADGNQNEWGFFDPSRCGYAALAATLDTVPEEVQQSTEPSPADMLLLFETGADPAAPSEPTAVPASAPAWGEAPASAPTYQEAPTAARCERRRDQPAPLALWAHLFGREDERSASHALLRYTEAMAGVTALLVGLNVPAQIAGVRYGSGCRIHRVRGLACAELTGPVTFEVASSQPDLPLVTHSAISESNPAA